MRLRLRGALVLAAGAVLLAFGAGQEQNRDDIAAGLAAWRKPDKLGRACASCHSPDGIELATYAFDAATIRRRATPHLGAEDADTLVRYVQALRVRLGIKRGLDPMLDRPLQPGGRVLSGSTVAERDRAFALSLDKALPSLMAERIETLEQARAALSEVTALDASKVQIGIALNRLSEDTFHGKDHATLANWIPDQAPFPYSLEFESAQKNYLADPTDRNLHLLDHFFTTAWNSRLSPAAAIALAKARSLLLYQHRLRTGKLAVSFPPLPDMKKAPSNPFWELGELARIYENSEEGVLKLPADVVANKSGGLGLAQQLRSMRVPWMWLGWIADPGLQRTSFDKRTRYADWFSEFLVEDGYPAHAAFMLTKKIAAESYEKTGWGSPSPQHLDLNFSWILRNENWRTFALQDAHYRQALYKFLSNAFRMFAFLQTEELDRTGVTYLREPVVQQLRFMQAATAAMDPSHAKVDAAIFDSAVSAVNNARLAS